MKGCRTIIIEARTSQNTLSTDWYKRLDFNGIYRIRQGIKIRGTPGNSGVTVVELSRQRDSGTWAFFSAAEERIFRGKQRLLGRLCDPSGERCFKAPEWLGMVYMVYRRAAGMWVWGTLGDQATLREQLRRRCWSTKRSSGEIMFEAIMFLEFILADDGRPTLREQFNVYKFVTFSVYFVTTVQNHIFNFIFHIFRMNLSHVTSYLFLRLMRTYRDSGAKSCVFASKS